MWIVLITALSLGIFVILHILFCRFVPAKKLVEPSLWILSVFCFIICNLIVISELSWVYDNVMFSVSLMNLPLGLSSAAAYWMAVLFYYIFFINADYDSPSQRILKTLQQRGPQTREELLRAVTSEYFILDRMEDLCANHFIRKKGDEFVLAPKGLLLVKNANLYRKLINRDFGG